MRLGFNFFFYFLKYDICKSLFFKLYIRKSNYKDNVLNSKIFFKIYRIINN